MRPTPSGEQYRRMISGQLYDPRDAELAALVARARTLTFQFNLTPPQERSRRTDLLKELFGSTGEQIEVEPRLHVDLGLNIHVGERFYANTNCVLLDVAEIRIGDDVWLAPGVQLLTATHPIDPQERTSGLELGFPITLGNRVWLGAGVLVGPGVTIGDDTVVGFGAVVVKDLPPRVVAVGNPARIIRRL